LKRTHYVSVGNINQPSQGFTLLSTKYVTRIILLWTHTNQVPTRLGNPQRL